MNEEILSKKLEELVEQINASNSIYQIEFNRQSQATEKMSLSGANGRLGVSPSGVGYDISLSGKSIQHQMYGFMRDLCGKDCDGYKQLNTRLGIKNEPFWRVANFSTVIEAAFRYARTAK